MTPFSRGGRDYYFQSVFADFASLVFVALSYQYAVNGDNEALVQTYNQGLFPIDAFSQSPSSSRSSSQTGSFT